MLSKAQVRRLFFRRLWLFGGLSLLIWLSSSIWHLGAGLKATTMLATLDSNLIIASAEAYLDKAPRTITSIVAVRSAGGIHDYYSEGPYWWPNTEDPQGPYIRRDGERNPERFHAHGQLLHEMVDVVVTLTAAYTLTADRRYAQQALRHLHAWFVAHDTRMNPSLAYSQAIFGIATGRGIGIIDTVALIEVALSFKALVMAGQVPAPQRVALEQWFSDYADWLTTHSYGTDERDHGNNHSTWWGAQLTAYAWAANRSDLAGLCQSQFQRQLPLQMASDGSFPKELARTRPGHYTVYNLRAWTTYALLLRTTTSRKLEDEVPLQDLKRAVDFLVSYLQAPATWPYATVLEPQFEARSDLYLQFAYWLWKEPVYLQLWEQLPAAKPLQNASQIIWQKLLHNE